MLSAVTFSLIFPLAMAFDPPADGPPADAPATTQAADEASSQPADATAGEESEEDAAARRRAERLEQRRAEREAERLAEAQERELRRAIGRHFSDVRLYLSRFLVPGERDGDTDKFDEGRRRVLEIEDPMAIPAIIEILGKGSSAVRRVMVEALDQFVGEDDATGYLLVVTLADPDPALRNKAAMALLKRKGDRRIVQELLRALDSEDEAILRNAATALGVMGDDSVVPDLIDRLSMEYVIEVPVTRESLFTGIGQTYVGGFRAKVAPGVAQIEPIVSGAATGVSIGFGEDEPVIEYKTVHRTEVQEALIVLTGVNHGFDRDKWLEWWDQYKN